MIEKIEKIWNNFKTGIVMWILSYFIYYIVAIYVNNVESYNALIFKLLKGNIFLIQACVAGIVYVILEIIINSFFTRIIKAVDTNDVKVVIKKILIAILLMIIEFGIFYIIKFENIIGKEILTIIIGLIIFKGVGYSIILAINNYKYNKKLQEKNNKIF